MLVALFLLELMDLDGGSSLVGTGLSIDRVVLFQNFYVLVSYCRDESTCVTFAVLENTMNNDVLGGDLLVSRTICEGTGFIVLEDTFTEYILWLVTSSDDEISFINDCSAKLWSVEAANRKETLSIIGWNMQVPDGSGNCIRTFSGRSKANRTRNSSVKNRTL